MNQKAVDIDQVIEESRERTNTLFPEDYDPVTGTGSPIEREPFIVDEDRTIYLPVQMFNDGLVSVIHEMGGLHKALEDLLEDEHEDFWYTFMDIRCQYDFEYWAETCATILDKETKDPIPFRLRAGQRKLLKALEDMRQAGKPIRIILLKARQWGGSTLVQLYMSWIQIYHETNWHSAIVADVESQARKIRSMYSRLIDKYPKEFRPNLKIKPFEGSSKNKIIQPMGCEVSIGSMQKPDGLRSGDLAMLHMSEVGLWKKTEGKSPMDLIQALRGALSEGKNTVEVIESTAKGVGSFFHSEWLNAVAGKTNSVPVFVAFFEIELYQKAFKSHNECVSFISSMDEYEWELWKQGAPLEAIHWYRYKLRDMQGQRWRMQSEYPANAKEAFQSTGHRVFVPAYVRNARETCIEPIAVGELVADARTGPGALKNIEFQEVPNGRLKIWSFPGEYSQKKMLRRYGSFADIGGRSEKADKSVIDVMDRYFMLQNGMPEVAAQWRGNIDQDIFAWKCAQIGKWYWDALIAIEIQSLRTKDKDSLNEGDHSHTILDEIAKHYKHLYSRTNPEQRKKGVPNRYGFHTNHKSKGMIMDLLNAGMRDSSYVERDSEFCDEAEIYEYKEDGSMGAVEGPDNHDDRVMTKAGVYWLCTKHMKLPEYDTKPDKAPNIKPTIARL